MNPISVKIQDSGRQVEYPFLRFCGPDGTKVAVCRAEDGSEVSFLAEGAKFVLPKIEQFHAYGKLNR